MEDLQSILALRDGPQKTAALVAWIQGLFSEEERPVLVGGAAVELLTGGAYTTGDPDFVGTVTREAAAKLKAAGFERRGRHWLHPGGELFVEFPAESLDAHEEAVSLAIAGRVLRILAPEAVLVDRLAAWQHWRSSTDAVNAFLVYRATRGRLDRSRLMRLVEARQVGEAWARLESLARGLGERSPTPEELEQWAESAES